MIHYDPKNPPSEKELADDLLQSIADQLPELAKQQAVSAAKAAAREVGNSPAMRKVLRDAMRESCVAYIQENPGEVLEWLFRSLCRQYDGESW